MMGFFDLHVDRQLKRLGEGTITPERYRQAVRHARNCHRCAALFERAIHTLRMLEHGDVTQPAGVELSSIEALNVPAARGQRQPVGWWVLLPVAAGLVMGLVGVGRERPDAEFSARGDSAGGVSFRVFCGGGGRTLDELREGGSCAVGRSLAFAAGSSSELSRLVLAVKGSAVSESSASVGVTASPGAEAPVALTVSLERAGEVNIAATFASDEDSAERAARGEKSKRAVTVRRVVRVTP
jgi:hypothetical protein